MRKLGGPLPKVHVVNNSVYYKRTLFGSRYWKEGVDEIYRLQNMYMFRNTFGV